MNDKELNDRIYEFLKGEKLLGDDLFQGDRIENKDFNAVLHELDVLSKKSCQPDEKRIWGKIYRHVVVRHRRLLIRRWSIAAAVLMPAVLATVLFLYMQSSRVNAPAELSVVARNQVQLFMNDGRVVHLQQIDKDSVVDAKGAGIRIDKGQSIVYSANSEEQAELVYHTLSVPRCCEYHLVLSDGTEVWMNSDSELRFPVDFVGKERRVFLKGEAYFQVAKNVKKPFRVEAGAMQVEALGTGFDVSAYHEDGKLMATLVEGSVRVSDLSSQQQCILVPGKQARLQDGVLSSEEVNVNDVTGWKEGRFVFNNMQMEEIARQLERWYDVKIDFQDVVVKYYRFTGVMKRYNQLSQLIELIEETTDVKFQVNGREIRIFRR